MNYLTGFARGYNHDYLFLLGNSDIYCGHHPVPHWYQAKELESCQHHGANRIDHRLWCVLFSLPADICETLWRRDVYHQSKR